MSGLTPSSSDAEPADKDSSLYQQYLVRRKKWGWFYDSVKSIGRIDVAVWNGDLIDGQGRKNAGKEMITTDRYEQGEIALRVIKAVNAKANHVVVGTGYHEGQEEDWGSVIANKASSTFQDHLTLEVDGYHFDFKHFIGGSNIPHGRATALERDKVWNELGTERRGYPKADVLVRSHRHYFLATVDSYGPHGLRYALITPPLQGVTEYGTRNFNGTVDYGFVYFEVKNEELSFHPVICQLHEERQIISA